MRRQFALIGAIGTAFGAGIVSASSFNSAEFATTRNRFWVENGMPPQKGPKDKSHMIFLGTGTSSGTPTIDCLLGLAPRNPEKGGCEVCQKALNEGPALTNKNVRGNPSLLIAFKPDGNEDMKYIQIDVCKTFRESVLTWFTYHDIPRLDAVVLTHEHADAIFGIDDLRAVAVRGRSLDVFSSFQTFKALRKAFPYLVREPLPSFHGAAEHLSKTSEALILETERVHSKPKTFVASLKFHAMATPSLEEEFVPFNAAGLEMIPFPVYHGPGFLSLGFIFGKGSKKIVYISDVSEISDNVMAKLKQLDIAYLIIDCLHPDFSYISHLSLDQSLAFIAELAPDKTLLIGVSHRFEHERDNKKLAKLKEEKGLDVQIAFDGQRVDLDGLV